MLVTPYKMMKMFASVNFVKHKYNPAGNKNTKICRKKQNFHQNNELTFQKQINNKKSLQIFSDQSVNSHCDSKFPGVNQINESHRQFDFNHILGFIFHPTCETIH